MTLTPNTATGHARIATDRFVVCPRRSHSSSSSALASALVWAVTSSSSSVRANWGDIS